MKKLKMAVMAFAAISSIGSAFAFSPVAKRASSTYYAIKNGVNSFRWTQTTPDPDQLSCGSAATGVCTIVTNVAPTDNSVPANHSSDPKGLYQ